MHSGDAEMDEMDDSRAQCLDRQHRSVTRDAHGTPGTSSPEYPVGSSSHDYQSHCDAVVI